MDKARDFVEKVAAGDEAGRVSRLNFPPHQPHHEPSFYENFIFRGIHLDRREHGSLFCSFKVPPRLTGKDGKLAMGAIATIVDGLGAAVIYHDGIPMDVSVDMSISYISDANVNDELEIVSRCLGRKGSYSGTHILIRNKMTGDVVAEGRHSLFTLPTSKM